MNRLAPDDSDSPLGGWPTPRSVYIHVPFCRHRCGYCNFSVVTGRDDLVGQFVDAIDAELAKLNRPEIQTVFIGGGTPTHLPNDQLDRLLQIVADRLSLDAKVEWSVEANPEDITDEKLILLRRHGVNRLSLGVQSFQADKLALLERSHSSQQAQRVICTAAELIPNISIDLIFGAPGETLGQWQEDLQTALALPITHLSTYALTFEKGTSFWTRKRKGELTGTAEQTEINLYNATRLLTKRDGWSHYEISNFARNPFGSSTLCLHNFAYWQGRGWYAVGPGAASFVDGYRNVNHRSPTTYLKRVIAGVDPVAESERITPMQYARERAAFGMRMLNGIDLVKLGQETGIDLVNECAPAIEQSMADELIVQEGDCLKLSEKGILFADTVASAFLG